MGHVVEAATVPPVSPNMQGMSLYRSPSKIMPSLPSHTPHKAGQPARPVTTSACHVTTQRHGLWVLGDVMSEAAALRNDDHPRTFHPLAA